MYSLVHNFVDISRLTNFAKPVKIVHKMWSNLPFSFLHAFLDTSTMNGKNVTWYHTLAPIILKRQKFDSSSLHDSFQLRKNLLSWTFLKMFLRRIMRCNSMKCQSQKGVKHYKPYTWLDGFSLTDDGLGLICSSKNWPLKCSNLVLLTELKT